MNVFLSRYDHFSVLCELLPVAIPSLAVCLQALENGTVTILFSQLMHSTRVKCPCPKVGTGLLYFEVV